MPSLTVNGQPLLFRLDPQTPLLWALRDGANLTGTKYGCGTGDCGACTVLVDGQALRSCQLTLAEAEGRSVTTIEGLSADGPSRGNLHPVQRALVAEQAIQCGFCTPGIVMAAVALLNANASPSDEDIEAAVPNLCRCGVYPRLLRAIRRAAADMRASAPAPASTPTPTALPAGPGRPGIDPAKPSANGGPIHFEPSGSAGI